MDLKSQITQLRKEGKTYREIGLALGTSEQRIHQIYKNYNNHGRGWTEKYNQAWKELCEVCSVNNSVAIHHSDGNNSNDSLENLRAVCKACHLELHIALRNRSIKKRKKTCTVCGISVIVSVKVLERFKGLGKCEKCLMYILNRKKFGPSRQRRRYEVSDRCSNCGIHFSRSGGSMHVGNDLCRKCKSLLVSRQREGYKKDEIFLLTYYMGLPLGTEVGDLLPTKLASPSG